MRDSGVVIVIWACVLLVVTLCALPVRTEDLGHFTSTWAVHIPGGKEKANLVARDHGFINLGEVSLTISKVSHKSKKYFNCIEKFYL